VDKKVAAVIVGFHPDAQVLERVAIIARQVDRLYFVDNSPEAAKFGALPGNVELIHNHNKGGLAGALNIALNRAKQAGFTHFFLFDQDTDVQARFCAQMIDAAEALDDPRAAIFAPRHVNSSTGHPVRLSVPGTFLNSKWPVAGDQTIECLFLINSCSLLKLDRIPDALRYDETLGVDMIDVDFSLAAARAGVKLVCFTRIEVRHGIGNRVKGSMAFSATHYSSHRKYLQTRNRIVVWKRYFSDKTAFVLGDIAIWLMDCARTLIFESQRGKKSASIAKGVVDGVRAR
jgi:rhamnosyltransferase